MDFLIFCSVLASQVQLTPVSLNVNQIRIIRMLQSGY